ncbi:MAG: transposase [Gemmatimonadetes bacterium]|nr:transposase [Gemmatimonadota bacterium]
MQPPGDRGRVPPRSTCSGRCCRRCSQQTLQEEFTRFLGAAPFERTDARAGVRNGTRPRTLVTRVGTVALQVPRDRASLFEPTVFVRYQRHEQALVCTSPSVTCRASRPGRYATWSRRCVARP